MSSRKIGVIVPHIITNVDRELLSGIFAVLQEYGYDLYVITGISNYPPDIQGSVFARRRENTFHIIGKGDFDGFIFVASWFTDPNLKKEIYGMLDERSLPCVSVEDENPYFPSIFPEQRKSERELTNHLIRVHGCRRLYFLSGFENNYVSDERLEGFKEALQDNGIGFSKDMVFYGDFWKEKSYELGRRIACGEVEKPDGVVCASDTMALSLTDGLRDHGMRVPEDVKVVGNDGKIEAFLHFPTLTTASGRNADLGQDAALMLIKMTEPDKEILPVTERKQCVEYRGSCGCDGEHLYISSDIMNELCRNNIMYNEKYISMVTDFIENVSDRETLEDLMMHTAMFSYRLPNWESMAVCLCEDWHFDFKDPSDYRREGFSDHMIAALAKIGRLGECSICKEKIDTAQLIPSMLNASEPKVWLITSLFSKDQIFGYAAVSYRKPDDIFLDENHCMWCDTISRGLRDTQNILYEQYVQHRIRQHADTDPETGMLSMRGFRASLKELLNGNIRYVLQMISVTEQEHSLSELNFISMLSTAIKNTASAGEISARYGKNTFVIAFPETEDVSIQRMMYQRLDIIENEMLQYESTGLHIELPRLAAACCPIKSSADIDEHIKNKLGELINKDDEEKDYRMQLLEIRHMIRKRPEKQWSIQMIADMLHISRTHLQRLYKEAFDINCKEDIIDIRIQKSKRLLKNTNKRVAEIASECGYENESHFIRQFHSKVGITATDFRKQHR